MKQFKGFGNAQLHDIQLDMPNSEPMSHSEGKPNWNKLSLSNVNICVVILHAFMQVLFKQVTKEGLSFCAVANLTTWTIYI